MKTLVLPAPWLNDLCDFLRITPDRELAAVFPVYTVRSIHKLMNLENQLREANKEYVEARNKVSEEVNDIQQTLTEETKDLAADDPKRAELTAAAQKEVSDVEVEVGMKDKSLASISVEIADDKHEMLVTAFEALSTKVFTKRDVIIGIGEALGIKA